MQIQKDPYRFINLALFVAASLINSTPSQAFSGVSPTIAEVYDVSQVQVNVTNVIYSISFLIMLLPANYIIDSMGLKTGTLICQLTNIIGVSVRTLINVDYSFFLLGTVISSVGHSFLFSAAPKFVSECFLRQEMFLANSLCVFALFTSDAIGNFLSSFYIHENSTREDIFQFIFWESCVMVLIQTLNVAFFRGKPKTLQNYASVSPRSKFKQDLNTLFSNRNYKILFLAVTLIFSDAIIMFVFLPWVSKFYIYENWMNGVIILSANLSGCIGCAVASLIKKRTGYRKLCISCGAGSILALSFMVLSFKLRLPLLTFITAGFNGLFAYPILSTASSFAIQTTFPVREANSRGILLFGGQFMGAVFVFAFSLLFGQSETSTNIIFVIIVFLMATAVASLYFTKEQLKRDEYEDSQNRENESLLSENEHS